VRGFPVTLLLLFLQKFHGREDMSNDFSDRFFSLEMCGMGGLLDEGGRNCAFFFALLSSVRFPVVDGVIAAETTTARSV
jgi:hypothetical protein